jgi:hypothetical protein
VSYGHIAYTLSRTTAFPYAPSCHNPSSSIAIAAKYRHRVYFVGFVSGRPWHRSVAAYEKVHLAIRQSRRGRTTWTWCYGGDASLAE